MSTWRDSRPARVLEARIDPHACLAIGVILSIVAAQSMKNTVPPLAVALCLVVAPFAGVGGRRIAAVRGAVAILAAGAISTPALSVLTGSSWSTALIVLTLTCVVPWLGGRYLRKQDELACVAAQRARLQERSRIAQDMHDSIGHELNLLALRAGAIEMDPALTATHHAAASQLRAGASSAITQLTAVIGVLRDGEPAAWGPPSPDIDELVRRAADAGMDVSLERNGPDRTTPPAVARCIHRVIQEGITNAARHAPGTTVTVTIDSNAEQTHVTVTNTPPDMTLRRSPGSRTGFSALEERMKVCGGTLSAGAYLGGFRLSARLPHGVTR